MLDLIVSNGSRPLFDGDMEFAPRRNEKTKKHAAAAIRLFIELNFRFIAVLTRVERFHRCAEDVRVSPAVQLEPHLFLFST